MNLFLRHIELFLSAAGILVILIIPQVLHFEEISTMTVAAITATLVGLLHGLIFWLVRQRQRNVRTAALSEIKQMLNDQINNNLAVIHLNLSIADSEEKKSIEASVNHSREAIKRISEILNNIGEESLQKWKAHYYSSHPYTGK